MPTILILYYKIDFYNIIINILLLFLAGSPELLLRLTGSPEL